MPTPEQTAAIAALQAKPYGDILAHDSFEIGEPVTDFTWNNRADIHDALISFVWDELEAFSLRTDNPHVVTLAQVLAADNTTVVPASQIDVTIARKAYVDTRTTGLTNPLVTAQTIIDEVVAARGAYPDLDTRLLNLVMAGTSDSFAEIFTSGQMLTDVWAGTPSAGSLVLPFTGGTYYDAGSRYAAPANFTFAAQPGPTTVYLYAQPGGAGLIESEILNPALGLLLGTAGVNATEVTSWAPASPQIVFDDSVKFSQNVTVVGAFSSPVTTALQAVSHEHKRGDCTPGAVPAEWNMPVAWNPLTANNTEVWRRGQEQNSNSYTITTSPNKVTFDTWIGGVDPDEWVYAKWTE